MKRILLMSFVLLCEMGYSQTKDSIKTKTTIVTPPEKPKKDTNDLKKSSIKTPEEVKDSLIRESIKGTLDAMRKKGYIV